MEGVVRTRVGYAGGTIANPTYNHLGRHAETVQIEYDPQRVSYEELLRVFWRSHDPTARPWSSQYRSVLFYHNEEQRRLALATKAVVEAERGRPVVTEIVPFTAFYLAEAYHQKYYLRGVREVLSDFTTFYPDMRDLVDSTAAARVNGYIGGHGTLVRLKQQLPLFGLSAAAGERLLDVGARVLPVLEEDIGLTCPVEGEEVSTE